MLSLLAASFALVPLSPGQEVSATGQPAELGLVAWQRDHDTAFARAREAERPVLLLFQEIPG